MKTLCILDNNDTSPINREKEKKSHNGILSNILNDHRRAFLTEKQVTVNVKEIGNPVKQTPSLSNKE